MTTLRVIAGVFSRPSPHDEEREGIPGTVIDGQLSSERWRTQFDDVELARRPRCAETIAGELVGYCLR
ncbi:MAG: hypothetical protein ACRDWT_03135, partial [Jatrophihabitantaceae bacterium]